MFTDDMSLYVENPKGSTKKKNKQPVKIKK